MEIYTEIEESETHSAIEFNNHKDINIHISYCKNSQFGREYALKEFWAAFERLSITVALNRDNRNNGKFRTY